MQTSVIIIAHNEEKYITKCIESVLHQTQKADEIILVAHNITDKTYEIAKNYPIKIVKLDGESGIVNARICGINNSTKDIILCIDGDSFAKNNWIQEMSRGRECFGIHSRSLPLLQSFFFSSFTKSQNIRYTNNTKSLNLDCLYKWIILQKMPGESL